ncbi:MAG TPA: hypothetical protein VIZ90_04360 [Rhizobiaceae bacterium]
MLRDLLPFRAGRAGGSDDWIDDPYAHPEIDAMSERERADLPPVHMPAPAPVLRRRTPSPPSRASLCGCA